MFLLALNSSLTLFLEVVLKVLPCLLPAANLIAGLSNFSGLSNSKRQRSTKNRSLDCKSARTLLFPVVVGDIRFSVCPRPGDVSRAKASSPFGQLVPGLVGF